jgi:hypothetical protein
MDQVLRMIEDMANSRPSAMEFELAYQARVAMDRIKFAIRHTEQFAGHSVQMREAGLQLLDALGRLEAVERRFQNRARVPAPSATAQAAQTKTTISPAPVNGSAR